MAFEFLGGAGAGASDALKEMILRQIAAQVQEQQLAQGQQRIDLEAKRFDADQDERGEARRFRQETRDRQDASDLIDSLSPGEITSEQASLLGKSPATKARVTPRTVLAARPMEGTAPLDGSGPQSFNVLEPTHEQAAQSFKTSERRRIITGLSPRGKMAAEAAEAGVPNAAINELIRDPQQERAERIQALTDEESIKARFRPPTQGPREPKQWVIGPDGKQAYRAPQPGDKRYDPVADRQSAAGTNMSEEARATAEQTLRVAKALRDDPNRSRVFGSIDGALKSFRQGSIDADSLVAQLTSLEALENMGKMKGVLSDKDIALIRQASSRLSNQRISDEAASDELNYIISTIQEKLGAGAQSNGGIEPMRPASSHGTSLAPGTERVINGTPAVWDGKGWLPK